MIKLLFSITFLFGFHALSMDYFDEYFFSIEQYYGFESTSSQPGNQGDVQDLTISTNNTQAQQQPYHTTPGVFYFVNGKLWRDGDLTPSKLSVISVGNHTESTQIAAKTQHGPVEVNNESSCEIKRGSKRKAESTDSDSLEDDRSQDITDRNYKRPAKRPKKTAKIEKEGEMRRSVFKSFCWWSKHSDFAEITDKENGVVFVKDRNEFINQIYSRINHQNTTCNPKSRLVALKRWSTWQEVEDDNGIAGWEVRIRPKGPREKQRKTTVADFCKLVPKD